MDRINLRSVRDFLPNCQWRVWGLDLVLVHNSGGEVVVR